MPRRRTIAVIVSGAGVAILGTAAIVGGVWSSDAAHARSQVTLIATDDVTCADPLSFADFPPGFEDDPDRQHPTFLPAAPLDCSMVLELANSSRTDVTVDSITFPSDQTFGMGIVATGLSGAGIHRTDAEQSSAMRHASVYAGLHLTLPAGAVQHLRIRIADSGAYCSSSGTTQGSTLTMTVTAAGISGEADDSGGRIQVGHRDGVKNPCRR